jgi:hypothetical protein
MCSIGLGLAERTTYGAEQSHDVLGVGALGIPRRPDLHWLAAARPRPGEGNACPDVLRLLKKPFVARWITGSASRARFETGQRTRVVLGALGAQGLNNAAHANGANPLATHRLLLTKNVR